MSPASEIIHVIPQEYIIDSESGIKTQSDTQAFVWKETFILLPDKLVAVKNIF